MTLCDIFDQCIQCLVILVLYTPISIDKRKGKKRFDVQNCPCGTVGVNRLCARAPRARQCSCRIW